MRKFRWLLLVCAIVFVIQTPSALTAALAQARTDHRLIPIMAMAFLFRLGWICALLFGWWKLRPNQVRPEINLSQRQGPPGVFEIDRAYYLSRPNSWWRFKLLAYDEVGKLAVSDTQIVFQSGTRTIVIDQIRQVSYGKQGRDFINDWVKVEYIIGGAPQIAFFADGGSLGWDGVRGGTAKLFQAMKRLPALA